MHRKITRVLAAVAFLVGCTYLAGAGDDKGAAAKKDRKALQGAWKTSDKNKAGIHIMKFDGDKVTVQAKDSKDDETITGTYTIDTTKNPKTIDIKVTGGTAKGAEKYKDKTSLGIYTFENGKLKWCANEPGRDERPGEFDGDKFVLIQFERAKK